MDAPSRGVSIYTTTPSLLLYTFTHTYIFAGDGEIFFISLCIRGSMASRNIEPSARGAAVTTIRACAKKTHPLCWTIPPSLIKYSLSHFFSFRIFISFTLAHSRIEYSDTLFHHPRINSLVQYNINKKINKYIYTFIYIEKN